MQVFRAALVALFTLVLVTPQDSAWARGTHHRTHHAKVTAKPGHVRAHHKKNGTHVRAHSRRAPHHRNP